MKKFIISEQENGMTLQNYMKKVLCNAPLSFIYKVIRKKDAKELNNTTNYEELITVLLNSIYPTLFN